MTHASYDNTTAEDEVQYVEGNSLSAVDSNTEGDFADVDVDSTEDEVNVGEPKGESAKKEDKATKRGDLPEGYTTPVGLAKIITDRNLYTTREGVVGELKPQMVYSYAKNAPKDNPFPAEQIEDSNGVVRNAVNIEEGIAWWIRKNERAQERRDNAAAKLSDKAKKAAEAASAKTDEAESDDSTTAEEAE